MRGSAITKLKEADISQEEFSDETLPSVSTRYLRRPTGKLPRDVFLSDVLDIGNMMFNLDAFIFFATTMVFYLGLSLLKYLVWRSLN